MERSTPRPVGTLRRCTDVWIIRISGGATSRNHGTYAAKDLVSSLQLSYLVQLGGQPARSVSRPRSYSPVHAVLRDWARPATRSGEYGPKRCFLPQGLRRNRPVNRSNTGVWYCFLRCIGVPLFGRKIGAFVHIIRPFLKPRCPSPMISTLPKPPCSPFGFGHRFPVPEKGCGYAKVWG